jgi:hypothetical protein
MTINLPPELLADLRATAEAAASPTSTRAMRYAAEQRLSELLTPEVVLALLGHLPSGLVGLKHNGVPVTFRGEQVMVDGPQAPCETLAERHERIYGRPHPVLDMLRRKPCP